MARNGKLHLINAQTQQELQLVKQSGAYNLGDDIVIGDLYKDPANPAVAVVEVTGRLHPEDLASLISVPANNPQSQSAT